MNKLFNKVIKYITPSLEKKGFQYPTSKYPRRLDSVTEFIWRRERGWITDNIRLSYPHYSKNLDFAFLVTYSIDCGDNMDMDETIFIGEGIGRIFAPTILKKLREEIIPSKALKLIESKMPWFNNFRTPEMCLEYLNNMKQKEKHMKPTTKAWYKQHINYFGRVTELSINCKK